MEFQGSIVKKTREEQGHKQYFFAQLTGITQSHLSRIENGKALPTIPELITISIILGMPLGYFVY
jgi:transcriptional regulator with XRE-family HTH domain